MGCSFDAAIEAGANDPDAPRVGGPTPPSFHVVVTMSVTIGNGTVVRATAVATSDVPDGTTVAGVPARQIGWADGRPFRRPSART